MPNFCSECQMQISICLLNISFGLYPQNPPFLTCPKSNLRTWCFFLQVSLSLSWVHSLYYTTTVSIYSQNPQPFESSLSFILHFQRTPNLSFNPLKYFGIPSITSILPFSHLLPRMQLLYPNLQPVPLSSAVSSSKSHSTSMAKHGCRNLPQTGTSLLWGIDPNFYSFHCNKMVISGYQGIETSQ